MIKNDLSCQSQLSVTVTPTRRTLQKVFHVCGGVFALFSALVNVNFSKHFTLIRTVRRKSFFFPFELKTYFPSLVKMLFYQ